MGQNPSRAIYFFDLRVQKLYPSPSANDVEGVDNFNKAHGAVAREITRKFREAGADEIVYRHPVQEEMEIIIPSTWVQSMAAEPSDWPALPDDTNISAVTRTWSLFQLNPGPGRQITWGWLKQRLLDTASGRRRIPWMDKIEKDIKNVMKDRIVDANAVTFISNQQVFRPILSREEVLRNGVRRMYVQFVETIPRQFPGAPRTSRLLASIMMASRYHFTYIEDWESFSDRFSPILDETEFNASSHEWCCILIRNRNRIALGGRLTAIYREPNG